ncbi:NAD-binding Rossmann fold oxidoreductase family protein [Bimuria novae-zelandiae CBS 107.79]|uniref:NAD-binding Rossmann fold oxidoreductase family protein n=1 Tax=Bimuria novae-zelandiae CBS 107.79 TaxID=1447943 RepID=A0A6A5VS57_9PLEO|nr:NAD-binding Rossmann fold oxidoreductase family protein [Bimuria novae-zelandiae CBS 107.79]
MAPTKIGFIGLSSTQSWAVWAHLPYLLASSKYEIVALCNSSVAAAQSAISAHALPPSTKAYGSPSDIAVDPDVDLIVCATRVDKHYECLVPALKAGKDVFCEWPLASNAAQAEEMLALAKEKGVRTLVGLQAGVSPAMRKMKSVIEEGKIGEVVSAVFHGTPTFFGGSVWEGHGYQQERSVGGNLVSIYGVHSLEAIQVVLGPLKETNPLFSIQFPTVQLTDHTGAPTTTVQRTSHDHFLLNGTLASGAVLSYSLRGGPAFDGSGAFWRIYGTKGAIQVTGPDSYLQIAEENISIKVFEYGKEGLEELHADKDEWSAEKYSLYCKNIARLYEGFADGKGAEQGVLGWEDAVKRQKFVEEMYKKAGVQ